MKLPTPAEVAAIKADAVKRFGSERALLVEIDPPVDAAVVVAPFDIASFSVYADAEANNRITGQSGAVVDRLLWPSLEELISLRSKWPSLDAKVAADLSIASGRANGSARVMPLTPGNAPRGLGPAGAKALLEANPTLSLWSVTHPGNELAIVMKSPLSEVYLAARSAVAEAKDKREGIIRTVLLYVEQHVVWAPEDVRQMFERFPGYIAELSTPLFEMGGSGAESRARFL